MVRSKGETPPLEGDAMRETLYFRLGNKDTISLPELAKAIRNVFALLADFDAFVSKERAGTVKWQVTVLQKASPPLIGVVGIPARQRRDHPPVDNVARVERAVISGVGQLATATEESAALPTAVVQKVRYLAAQSRRIGPIQIFRNDEDRTPIDSGTLETIQKLTGKSHSSDGSIIGTLDTITVRRGDEIRVWDESARRPVRCRYDRNLFEDRIKALLRNRVIVSGVVSYNPFGQPVSVDLDDIDRAPDESDLPTIEQMSGLLDDATGGLPLADYLTRLRDG